jgi:flagellin
MPISILTNNPALAAKRNLEESTEQLGKALERLASGKRINRSGDDAAGLTISDTLEARLRSLGQANRNTLDAVSLAQVAEGGMNEVSNLILRMRELAIQSASDTVGDRERELLQLEASELRAELERLAESTRYLGTPLLNGQGRDFVFQIGPDNNEFNRISYSASQIDLRPGTLGVDDVDLGERDNAQSAIETLDNALQRLGKPRAQLGAVQERMHSITRQLGSQTEGLTAAKSRILDADLAQEASDALKAQVRMKSATAVMAQANALPAIALRLLDA